MTDAGRPRIDMAAQYRARVAEVRRLRALLKRLEWAAGDDFGAACPECQGYRDTADSHRPDCELAAELRAAQPRPVSAS